jgi:hypothetical protein
MATVLTPELRTLVTPREFLLQKFEVFELL